MNQKGSLQQSSVSSNDDSPSKDSDDIDHIQISHDIPVYKLPDKLKHKNIIINLTDTHYPIIEEVAEELEWTIQKYQGIGDWDIWWTDREITPSILFRMHLHQKISHYPGIYVLARKNLLGLNLMKMKSKYPQQYDIFPQTWLIPLQFPQFRQFYEINTKKHNIVYIVKPQALCQGKGIYLTQNIDDISNGFKYVVQEYIKNPFLIDKLKFDLRLYVLLAGTDPLRIYLFEEGLTRFATKQYQKPNFNNLNQAYIHLTNYSLNKNNPDYIYSTNSQNMNQGHKRTLKSTFEHIQSKGYDVTRLKAQIQSAIVKTIISGIPLINHQYQYCQPQQYEGNMCFHILGFDIMIRDDMKPIVLQVNHTPSFETSSHLDYVIKKKLIADTLILIRATKQNKERLFEKGKNIYKKRLETGKRQIAKGQQRQAQIKHQAQIRDGAQRLILKQSGYKKIHPAQDPEQAKKYQQYIRYAKKVHKENQKFRKMILNEEVQLMENKKNQKINQSLVKKKVQLVNHKTIASSLTPILSNQRQKCLENFSQKNLSSAFRSTKINIKPHASLPVSHQGLNSRKQNMLKIIISQDIDKQAPLKSQQQRQDHINFQRVKNAALASRHHYTPGLYSERSQKRKNKIIKEHKPQHKQGAYLTPVKYEPIQPDLQVKGRHFYRSKQYLSVRQSYVSSRFDFLKTKKYYPL